ncbi:MAG: hypothetical protein Q9217_001521 [Psora testacea]
MARLNNEFRSNESPMDYQYDNGRGPTGDSPFVRDANNTQLQNGFAGQKRSSDELDSPAKSSLPGLRKAEGQTHLFNSVPAMKPTFNLYREPSAFTTPQRRTVEPDDTSAVESSPAFADSENTPDQPTRASPSKNPGALVQFQGSKSEKKSVTSGLLRSGKGEIAKPRLYTDAIHRRVSKRRRRETDRDVFNAAQRYSAESDSEDHPSSSDGPTQKSTQQKPYQSMGFIPSVLTFIDLHPNLPNTLSTYIQFFLNCFFAFCLMYVLYGVFSTIRHDIDERAMMESSEILAEMAVCAREFKENKCERDTRVPAMESVCNGWEKCMARDPYMVGRSRLSAGMFAEIFNSFIEPISIKAIIVSISVIVGCFAVNNLTFGIYRSRHQPPRPTHPQSTYTAHPSGHQMGHTPGYPHFQSPYQGHMGGVHGIMQQQNGFGLAGGESPLKRVDYR